MEKPREYTPEEVRTKFIKHIKGLIKYWDSLPDKSCKEKMEGLAFSILSTIDGSSIDLPGFILAPYPAKEDKDYHKKNGENYFAYNNPNKIKCDIAGSLHENFH